MRRRDATASACVKLGRHVRLIQCQCHCKAVRFISTTSAFDAMLLRIRSFNVGTSTGTKVHLGWDARIGTSTSIRHRGYQCTHFSYAPSPG
eukprot:m.988201 g.988201  ORF g.988201 m.988201 type:complete len:91 (-) comp23992_c0_seq1:2965-3237(-)